MISSMETALGDPHVRAARGPMSGAISGAGLVPRWVIYRTRRRIRDAVGPHLIRRYFIGQALCGLSRITYFVPPWNDLGANAPFQ
ncbi:unnamed protein product, partial [Iphiclides podalirius]